MEEMRDRWGNHPRVCPRCGSNDVLPILWGLPSSEAVLASEERKVLLGGCLVDGDSPLWRCLTCGQEGGRMQDIYPTAFTDAGGPTNGPR